MSEPAEAIELDEQGRALFEDWNDARASAQQWSERADELAAMLMERMGTATQARIDGLHVVTRIPASTYNRFDERRFHTEMPDVWSGYLIETKRSAHLRLPPKRRGT